MYAEEGDSNGLLVTSSLDKVTWRKMRQRVRRSIQNKAGA
ncbi:predicted protein [Histoplasma capsulatum var. duboisii H88]|uniref:Predicted protein n=1 Tax=Ajellomyces capsulatus (strain H88) TaxID=544711 RepID=F0ULB6_AJEC8|nr:predicted protein [Histoplasma capsulatum var. duboisii H88]